MEPEPSSYLILAVLLFISAIFSASETALVSLTPAKIKALNPEKNRSARLIQRLKDRPQKMLTTILLGNNVVNTGATAYATVVLGSAFGAGSLAIVTAIMTALIVVFTEIIPKALANRYPVQVASAFVYILLFVEYALYPLILVLEKLISSILRIFGNTNIQSVSEEELIAMISIGTEEGSLDKEEQELIENVLEFDDIEVEAIMTPRVRIDAISLEKTLKDAINFATETSRSRLPVFKEQIDNIVGVISVKDMLRLTAAGTPEDTLLADLKLGYVLRCPETRKINSLFNEFRTRHLHIGFVYDEHGGLEGLVTMEDILEQIVGEILDEDDTDEDSPEVVNVDQDTIMVSGETPLKYVLDALPTVVEGYDDNDPMAWIVLDKLNRYPQVGEKVELAADLFVQVKQINLESNVIEQVKVYRKRK
ncbi:HlyC/CorC family transporter [Candidatus Gracilibacteria bacterium]|jgi:putative hemolysin|nr:HlyC/CorC family transporter [Candidatus Gracilibacteria bacterium]